jgi:pyruvate,orthophosphate dikinase
MLANTTALRLRPETARIGGQLLSEGDVICLDAESGRVFAGSLALIAERPKEQLEAVESWRAARSITAARAAGWTGRLRR